VHLTNAYLPWIAFTVVVAVALSLDLGIFRKHPRETSVRSGLMWLGVWVVLAVLFNVGIWYWMGSGRALEFTTAYVMEESLSIDNMFVFYVTFNYFAVARAHQHRVLSRFEWITYLFGAFVVYSGVRLLFHDGSSIEPDKNPVVKLFRRFVPLSDGFEGHHFMTRRNGRSLATPLLLVLVLIEATDVAFATDSIPAVFAISRHPFIVYSSNVFAVLGLRSLYFVLAGVIGGLRYLHYGLAIVLSFIGIKMLIAGYYVIPTGLSLAVVITVIGVATTASLWKK
jgi:tellurite resistance protein TerC